MVIYGDTVETLSSNNGDNQPSHKERLPNSVQVQLFKIMISPQGLICTSAGQPQLPYLKKLLALQSIGTRGLTAGLMMSSVSHIYIYIYIYSRDIFPIFNPNIPSQYSTRGFKAFFSFRFSSSSFCLADSWHLATNSPGI